MLLLSFFIYHNLLYQPPYQSIIIFIYLSILLHQVFQQPFLPSLLFSPQTALPSTSLKSPVSLRYPFYPFLHPSHESAVAAELLFCYSSIILCPFVYSYTKDFPSKTLFFSSMFSYKTSNHTNYKIASNTSAKLCIPHKNKNHECYS